MVIAPMTKHVTLGLHGITGAFLAKQLIRQLLASATLQEVLSTTAFLAPNQLTTQDAIGGKHALLPSVTYFLPSISRVGLKARHGFSKLLAHFHL